MFLHNVDHYENFPVASVFLPKEIRHAVQVIYYFARSADDIADEGNMSVLERLLRIDSFKKELDCIQDEQTPQTDLFQSLSEVIKKHNIPLRPFYQLLSAFRQDVLKISYLDDEDLLNYCQLSANPVGHLMLHLFGQDMLKTRLHSNALCSALQLINHWQDVYVDWDKGRCYLSQKSLSDFGLQLNVLNENEKTKAFQDMLQVQCQRAEKLLIRGIPLVYMLEGRLSLEVRAIISAAYRVLKKTQKANTQADKIRPRLSWLDAPWIIWHMLFIKRLLKPKKKVVNYDS